MILEILMFSPTFEIIDLTISSIVKDGSLINDCEIKISSGNATIHDEIIVIENASSGANFVVFGPSGSTWTKNGNTFSSSLDNKTYWSVAMLPQGNYNLLDKANEYKTFAYTFPTDTRVVFDFEESSSIVKSDYIISTEVKEGESGSFLQGLLPHHWNNL